MKESSTLKSLFAKDRGMPKGANYPAKFEKTAFEKRTNSFTNSSKENKYSLISAIVGILIGVIIICLCNLLGVAITI